jgi:hypothetical protein
MASSISLIKTGMWSPLRTEFEQIRRQYHLPDSEFAPLNQHTNWRKLEEKIYSSFCKLDHPTSRPLWLWEKFKLDTYVLLPKNQPYLLLDKLVPATEPVWFMVKETGRDKFWFYEGKVQAIQTVIGESGDIDELYLISKQYDWLLCINHHDALIGTGAGITGKMKNIQARLKEE